MELRLDSANNGVPDDCYVSVRLGDIQKQNRFAPSRTYRFPNGSKYGRVDVFKRIGTCEMALPYQLDVGECPQGHVNLSVRCDDPALRELNFTVGFGAAAKYGSTTQKAKCEAREYMSHHGLEELLAEAMKHVLREKPSNPHQFLADVILSKQPSAKVQSFLPQINGAHQAPVQDPFLKAHPPAIQNSLHDSPFIPAYPMPGQQRKVDYNAKLPPLEKSHLSSPQPDPFGAKQVPTPAKPEVDIKASTQPDPVSSKQVPTPAKPDVPCTGNVDKVPAQVSKSPAGAVDESRMQAQTALKDATISGKLEMAANEIKREFGPDKLPTLALQENGSTTSNAGNAYATQVVPTMNQAESGVTKIQTLDNLRHRVGTGFHKAVSSGALQDMFCDCQIQKMDKLRHRVEIGLHDAVSSRSLQNIFFELEIKKLDALRNQTQRGLSHAVHTGSPIFRSSGTLQKSLADAVGEPKQGVNINDVQKKTRNSLDKGLKDGNLVQVMGSVTDVPSSPEERVKKLDCLRKGLKIKFTDSVRSGALQASFQQREVQKLDQLRHRVEVNFTSVARSGTLPTLMRECDIKMLDKLRHRAQSGLSRAVHSGTLQKVFFERSLHNEDDIWKLKDQCKETLENAVLTNELRALLPPSNRQEAACRPASVELVQKMHAQIDYQDSQVQELCQQIAILEQQFEHKPVVGDEALSLLSPQAIQAMRDEEKDRLILQLQVELDKDQKRIRELEALLKKA